MSDMDMGERKGEEFAEQPPSHTFEIAIRVIITGEMRAYNTTAYRDGVEQLDIDANTLDEAFDYLLQIPAGDNVIVDEIKAAQDAEEKAAVEAHNNPQWRKPVGYMP